MPTQFDETRLYALSEAQDRVRFPIARPWLPDGYAVRSLRYLGTDKEVPGLQHGWLEASFWADDERYIAIYAGRGAGPSLAVDKFPRGVVETVEVLPGISGFIVDGHIEDEWTYKRDGSITLLVEDAQEKATGLGLSLKIRSNSEQAEVLVRIAQSLPLAQALAEAHA